MDTKIDFQKWKEQVLDLSNRVEIVSNIVSNEGLLHSQDIALITSNRISDLLKKIVNNDPVVIERCQNSIENALYTQDLMEPEILDDEHYLKESFDKGLTPENTVTHYYQNDKFYNEDAEFEGFLFTNSDRIIELSATFMIVLFFAVTIGFIIYTKITH